METEVMNKFAVSSITKKGGPMGAWIDMAKTLETRSPEAYKSIQARMEQRKNLQVVIAERLKQEKLNRA